MAGESRENSSGVIQRSESSGGLANGGAGPGSARRREGAAGAAARGSDTQGGGSELAAPGTGRELTRAAGRDGVSAVGN